MNDQSTVRLVIGVLGLLALATVIGGICLAFTDRGLPGELIAIGSAAAGAVGGILSHTSGNPQEVVGPQGGPVPVTDEGGRVDPVLVITVGVVVVAVIALAWVLGADIPLDLHL